MFRNKTGMALRDLLEAQGEDNAQIIVREALASNKLSPSDFSIKEIWEACQKTAGKSIDVNEAIVSSAFPKITGELISSKIISAYNTVEKIGDILTTNIPSNHQIDTFAGFTDVETPEEVGETQEYNDSTMTEKYVTARNIKYGRMISVSEEMIYFDQTGQILMRANRVGIKAAQYKEKLILEAVQDINANVWKPSGTATAFYSTANGNLASTNAFGESGLQAVEKLMHNMKDDSIGVTNNDFVYIDKANMIVLVPQDLDLEAWQMANSTLTPESSENAANYYKARFRVLTSPYITTQSTTTWYMGDFKKDFVWSEVWPLSTISQRSGHDDEFKRDIKARVKVRFYGAPLALDVKHCYKSTAA